MPKYTAHFTEEKILEWRKKYLRYDLLMSQVKNLKNCNSFLGAEEKLEGADEQVTVGRQMVSGQLVCTDIRSLQAAAVSDVDLEQSSMKNETDSCQRGQQSDQRASPLDQVRDNMFQDHNIKLLQVTVVSATNLPNMNIFGQCDAFCEIEFCGLQRSTSVKMNSVDANWNETFPFNIAENASDLCLKVYDWEAMSNPAFVGKYTVPAEKISALCAGPRDSHREFDVKAVDGDGRSILGHNRKRMRIFLKVTVLDARLSGVTESKTVTVGKNSASQTEISMCTPRFLASCPSCVTERAETEFFDTLNEDLATMAEFQSNIMHQCLHELAALHRLQARLVGTAREQHARHQHGLDHDRAAFDAAGSARFQAQARIECSQIARAYEQLYLLVDHLRRYVAVNRSAVLRILHKHDKASVLACSAAIMLSVADGPELRPGPAAGPSRCPSSPHSARHDRDHCKPEAGPGGSGGDSESSKSCPRLFDLRRVGLLAEEIEASYAGLHKAFSAAASRHACRAALLRRSGVGRPPASALMAALAGAALGVAVPALAYAGLSLFGPGSAHLSSGGAWAAGWVHTHTRTHARTCTCACKCTRPHAYARTHKHTHTCTHAHAQARKHARTHACTHAHNFNTH
jgi:hypothetical protein